MPRNKTHLEFRRKVSSSKSFWCHLKKFYQLSPDEYIEMYERQGGVCASCRTETKLVVDHNHKTNKVRGLLCNRCNSIAGAIEDDRFEDVRIYLHSRGPSFE